MVISLLSLFSTVSAAQDVGTSIEDDVRVLQMRVMMQRSGMQLSPELEAAFQKQMQRQGVVQDRIRAASVAAAMGATEVGGQAQDKTSSATVLSDEALLGKLSSFPKRPDNLLIDDRKDGFSVNGAGYVDPEGAIRNYAIDPVSGLATYLAETEPNTFQIKVIRVGTDAEPVQIGTAFRRDSGWQVVTVTGKKMSGEDLTIMQGAGFLVARSSAAFVYRPGKGIQNVSIPNDFLVARFQRGDVLGTNHLLLERYVSPQSRDNNIFDSLKALGNTLGINKKEDYALFNFAKSEVIPINISDSGKSVGSYSRCNRRNAVVNDCARVDFRESLYDNIGKNLSHYYWRINWFSTPPSGAILIAQENGLKDITIRDLISGKKTIAFNRTLGISGYDAIQSSNGKIGIIANMGLSREKIDDAVAFLAKSQELGEIKAVPTEETNQGQSQQSDIQASISPVDQSAGKE